MTDVPCVELPRHLHPAERAGPPTTRVRVHTAVSSRPERGGRLHVGDLGGDVRTPRQYGSTPRLRLGRFRRRFRLDHDRVHRRGHRLRDRRARAEYRMVRGNATATVAWHGLPARQHRGWTAYRSGGTIAGNNTSTHHRLRRVESTKQTASTLPAWASYPVDISTSADGRNVRSTSSRSNNYVGVPGAPCRHGRRGQTS